MLSLVRPSFPIQTSFPIGIAWSPGPFSFLLFFPSFLFSSFFLPSFFAWNLPFSLSFCWRVPNLANTLHSKTGQPSYWYSVQLRLGTAGKSQHLPSTIAANAPLAICYQIVLGCMHLQPTIECRSTSSDFTLSSPRVACYAMMMFFTVPTRSSKSPATGAPSHSCLRPAKTSEYGGRFLHITESISAVYTSKMAMNWNVLSGLMVPWERFPIHPRSRSYCHSNATLRQHLQARDAFTEEEALQRVPLSYKEKKN